MPGFRKYSYQMADGRLSVVHIEWVQLETLALRWWNDLCVGIPEVSALRLDLRSPLLHGSWHPHL
jgi:hypothetical protein